MNFGFITYQTEKLRPQRIMVKAAYKSDLPWSATFTVIVCLTCFNKNVNYSVHLLFHKLRTYLQLAQVNLSTCFRIISLNICKIIVNVCIIYLIIRQLYLSINSLYFQTSCVLCLTCHPIFQIHFS